MGHDAIKLELIEWLTRLEDKETIEYLKIVKDSKSSDLDWWDELPEGQKEGIQRGLKDKMEGRVFPHNEIKTKYGL